MPYRHLLGFGSSRRGDNSALCALRAPTSAYTISLVRARGVSDYRVTDWMTVAPRAIRFCVATLSNVTSRLPFATSTVQRASVLPPGDAYGTRTESDISATNIFRW